MDLTLTHAEKRLEAFGTSFDNMELTANKLTINSGDDMAIGNELIAQAKSLQNKIEERRLSVYDEIYPKEGRKVVKGVNTLAKKFKDRLTGIINIVDTKYMTYHRKIKQKEATELLYREEELARAKEKRDKLFIPPNLMRSEKFNMPAPAEIQEAAANLTKSDSGSSYIKKIKGYRVTDFSKVPDSYKMLDETSVRQVMNSKDRHDIPGIEWTLEEKRVTRLS
jgi:hypothetical protein